MAYRASISFLRTLSWEVVGLEFKPESDSKAVVSLASARVQSGARGDGFAFKEHQMVQCRTGCMAAPVWAGMRAPPNLETSGMGLMSLSVDIGPQAARHAGSIPGPAHPAQFLQHAQAP